MSPLFAELYLDEDVDVTVGRLLHARGFKAIATRDAAQLGATDEEQLLYATGHEFVLVTHNRGDFEELHRRWSAVGREHSGLIILARNRAPVLVATLSRLLDRVSADEFKGQILYG